jgi:hypothetical protein
MIIHVNGLKNAWQRMGKSISHVHVEYYFITLLCVSLLAQEAHIRSISTVAVTTLQPNFAPI